jgi:septal ring factor EnvC (AmiA/AmiB activator)
MKYCLFLTRKFAAKHLYTSGLTKLSPLNMPVFSLLLILCCSLLAPPLYANTDNLTSTEKTNKQKQDNQKRLNDIHKAIAAQKDNIFKGTKQRTSLEKQLKKDDLAIAAVAKSINETKQNLNTTQAKIVELSKTKRQLQAQKKSQERLLGQQLRSAYTTGHHDYLKLLLNQDQSEKIQRTLSYYQYLNQARIDEIQQFQQTLATLLEVTGQHQDEIENLKALEVKQVQQKRNLDKTKVQRRKTLQALNKKLLSSNEQLAKLTAEESNLNYALQKLESLIQAEFDLLGLSKLKRKLAWPVKGKLRHRFGTRKQGYLKWKGVLISAPIGRQVETIHNGTILFSDWLKGYGLLTVIDHGHGYMSLYAHNQALLKSVGDRVETGEAIALVGQSGGQDQPGVYFEIRHQGKAVNPKLWCR